MHPDPGSGHVQHSDLVGWTRGPGPDGPSPTPATPAPRAGDADAGRAALAMRREPDDALSPERLAELRGRVRRGVYGSRAVVDLVARRLLQSGDV
jgi:hypothetical protein